MAVNNFRIFRNDDGSVGLREKDTGKELYWDADRKGWYAQDEFGEFQIAGDDSSRGSTDVQAIDYAVAEQDGNTTLLVKTDGDNSRFEREIDTNNFTSEITASGYKPDGTDLVVGDNDGNVVAYSATSNYSVDATFSVGSSVSSVEWLSSNTFALTIFNGNIEFRDDTYSSSPTQTITTTSNFLYSGSYNKTTNTYAVGDGNGRVQFYEKNASTGNYEKIAEVSSGSDVVSGLDWNESSNLIAATDASNNKVYVYDGSDYSLVTDFSTGNQKGLGSFPDLVFKEGGKIVVSLAADGVVEVYDDQYTLDQTLNVSPSAVVNELDLDSQGRILVGSSDNNIYLYSDNFNLTNTYSEATSSVTATEFNSNENSEFFGGTANSKGRVYSIQRNQLNLSDSTLPDGFDLSVANDGTGIIEINEDGTTIFSDVGNAPKVIDNGATADISKIDNDRYLVEGDIYKEENSRFKKQA